MENGKWRKWRKWGTGNQVEKNPLSAPPPPRAGGDGLSPPP